MLTLVGFKPYGRKPCRTNCLLYARRKTKGFAAAPRLAGLVFCYLGILRESFMFRLQGYYLVGRPEEVQFTKWELAGNLGGEDFPDKTRKILNEGTLAIQSSCDVEADVDSLCNRWTVR